MTLDEARTVVEIVSQRLSENAKIIWGAQISDDLKNVVRAMIIVTGVHSAQIFGPNSSLSAKKISDMENQLGIEYI